MSNSIDIAIIIIFLIGMLIVGYYASQKIKDHEDFSIAGRRFGFPVLLGTLIASCIGASSTMGQAGKAYEHGIALFVATIAYSLGLILFGLIAPTIRQSNVWNVPEILYIRYGKGMRLVFGVTLLLGVIALFGTQLIAVGLVVTSVMGNLGINYVEAIIGACVVMTLYTMMGGLLAVAYTDVVQTIIMILAVGVILPIIVFYDMGASTTIQIMIPEPGNFWGELTPIYLLSIFVTDILFCLIDPSLWQRTAAAKNSTSIKKGMFVTAGVYTYWSLMMVFLGIAAAHLFPHLAGSEASVDAAIPSLIVYYMPVGLKGLAITAMMAVMMSTSDTALLVAGTTASHDIVKPLFPDIEEKKLMMISRGVILFIGLLGIVFALNMKGLFDLILLALAIFVSGGFVPTMAAIFWKTATKAGAVCSSISGSVLVVALYGLKLSDLLPGWIEPIIISVMVSFIAMFGISWLTYSPKTATERLYKKHMS